ncbi:hypothetical protein [Thiocapsa imhoffii]|nr:hypothetical protein [Thiocapsa imhoffii]
MNAINQGVGACVSATPMRYWLGAGVLALSGCGGDLIAPDSLFETPGAEAFYNQIADVCGHLSVGNQPLNYLINVSDDNVYFLDETSKLYFGRIDRSTYATDLNGFYPTGTNTAALNCIFEQLDQSPPS